MLAVDSEKLKVVLKEDPLYFEKILPYAIAFWIGDSRAEKCFQHIEYRETWEIVSEKMYNDSLALQPIFSNVVDLPSFIHFMNYYYKTKKDKTLELSTLKKNKEVHMIKTMQEYSNKKELYKKYL